MSTAKLLTVHAHKAVPALRSETTQGAQIILDEQFPIIGGDGWEHASRDIHIRDAEQIFSALAKTLPGGTMNYLHALMVKHYAGLFTIPQATP